MPQTNLIKARKNADKLGVTVKASSNKHKKLDVFKQGKKIASIGHIAYSDLLQHGDTERRERYKKRHESNRHKKDTAGYFADRILWS